MKLINDKKVCKKCSKHLRDLPEKKEEKAKQAKDWFLKRGYNQCLKDCEEK